MKITQQDMDAIDEVIDMATESFGDDHNVRPILIKAGKASQKIEKALKIKRTYKLDKTLRRGDRIVTKRAIRLDISKAIPKGTKGRITKTFNIGVDGVHVKFPKFGEIELHGKEMKWLEKV